MDIVRVNYRSDESLKKEVQRFRAGRFSKYTQQRLEQPWGAETYGICAALEAGQCIGTTSYTVSKRGQGILSQVMTDPERRRQGIAGSVLQATVRAFRDHGTRAAYLAVWVDWIERLYAKFGFERVGCAGRRVAMKLTLDASGEDGSLFRAGQRYSLREV